MNDLHDLFTRAAEAAPLTGPDLASVKRRAHAIRRRRLAGAVGGIAVTVAAVTGIAVAVAPGGGQSSAPIGSSTTGRPTYSSPHVASPGTATSPAPVRVIEDVPAEQAHAGRPGVPYWHDGELHPSHGAPTPFGTTPLRLAEDPRGGWLVEVRTGAGLSLVPVGQTAATNSRITFADGLATGPKGIAYLDRTGARPRLVFVFGDGRTSAIALPADTRDAAIDAMTTQGQVVLDLDPDGTEIADPASGTLTAVRDASAYPPTSDDGRYAYRVSYGPPEQHLKRVQRITVRDATTRAVLASYLAPSGGFFSSFTWDGDRVLAVVAAPTLHSTPSRGYRTWFLAWLGPEGYQVARSSGVDRRGGQPAYVLPNG